MVSVKDTIKLVEALQAERAKKWNKQHKVVDLLSSTADTYSIEPKSLVRCTLYDDTAVSAESVKTEGIHSYNTSWMVQHAECE